MILSIVNLKKIFILFFSTLRLIMWFWSSKNDFSKITVVTFVNLNDLHEFASLIYNTPSRFTRGDLHLSLRFTRLQIYNFSKRQGSDLQLLRRQRSTLIRNKTVTLFFRIYESVLRRSQERNSIFGRITLQTKREKWKYCQISYLFCFASLTTFPSTSVWIANAFFHFNKTQFIDAI